MTNPSNSAPVPWHTPRDIDGHDRYSWHYHSPDTDRRIVMRLEPGTGMPASTVVGDVRVTRTSTGDLFIAYDNDGVRLGEGTSAECVAMVAQTDRAAQLVP